MITIFLLLSFTISITTAQQSTSSQASNPCMKNSDCVQGVCDTNKTTSSCICNRGWTFSRDGFHFVTLILYTIHQEINIDTTKVK
ncbi:unnamed protein product [Rotaria sp. Silwood2]|nr:unnamed protein product [Rotaria sp. Silwood2]